MFRFSCFATFLLAVAFMSTTQLYAGAQASAGAGRAVDFRYAPSWWQTAICLVDDWQKTLVGKDGSLLYDYPGAFSEFRTRIRWSVEGEEWVRQELASPRIPIVRTHKRAGSVEVLEEAFALPSPARRGSPRVERVGSQTILRNWAQPADSCDTAFRHIAVGFGQPIRYRIRTEGAGPYTVVFGLCEGYHKEPGRRILDLQVEGETVRTVDPLADKGANVPAIYAFEARDENGDGRLDLAVAAAQGSPDNNAILNLLWVFPGSITPDLDSLRAGRGERGALARVEGGLDLPNGQSRSDVLLFSLHNTGSAEQSVRTVLTIDSDLPESPDPSGRVAWIGSATAVLLDQPWSETERTETGYRLKAEVRLKPGQKRTVGMQVARGAGAGAERASLGHPDRLRASCERYWKSRRLPYNVIQVPDTGIQAALESSVRNIYQAREIKNKLPAFQVGPTCYRGLWVVDGSFLLESVAFLGRTDEARAGIRYLLSFQREDGGFSLMEGHWKETGIALWAVTRHARLSGDRKWLMEVWPKLERAFAYIRSLRKIASKDAEAPNCGLIPDGFSDGGLGGRYPEYTNTYWTLVGLKSAVDAARWLDKSEEAADWQREYDDMLATFRRAADRDARDDGTGNRFVPIRMRDDEKSAPQKGQWAFLHAIFPGRVFAADDPLVKGNLAMLESVEREGLVLGTGWLNEGIWNYFASFYAHAWLWQGRGEKAAGVLYDFVNHASPLLAWREEQMPVGQGAQICGDMPHNWASAELIRLVRHLLVLERGDELHLLEGLPAEWIYPGAAVRLRDVATEFGPISLSLDVAPDGRVARLRIDPPKRVSARRILLHMGSWAAQPGIRELGSSRKVVTIPLR